MAARFTTLPLVHRGKVRDTHAIPGADNFLLQISTDRVSTYNVPHCSTVPGKGELLTALTIYWHRTHLADIATHVAVFGKQIYQVLPTGYDYAPDLHLRAIIVRKLDMIPVEFIWRNCLAGSLWSAYRNGDDPYRLSLTPGLPLMHRFKQPVFTPTAKSENDEPLPSAAVAARYSAATAAGALATARVAAHLESRGALLIDWKLEFGLLGEKVVLADEIGTGDSSRMARLTDVAPGAEPLWLDKQVFRDAAASQWGAGPKTPLVFSDATIARGIERYHNAFTLITEMALAQFQSLYLNEA